MGIEVQLKDGAGSGKLVAIDKQNNIKTLEQDPPIRKTHIVNTAKTIQGITESFGVADSDAKWRLKQTKIVGGITEEIFASSGQFNQIWDQRLVAFPEVIFNNSLAVLFLNVNDHINLGNNSDFDIAQATDNIFISVWFKNSVTGEKAIISKQGSTNNAGWRLTTQSNNVRFHLSGGLAAERIEIRTVVGSLSDGSYHHIGLIKDAGNAASTIRIWIDGVEDTSFTSNSDNLLAGSVTTNSIIAQISGRNVTNVTFEGSIDLPSFFKSTATAFTEADVLAAYGNRSAVDLRQHSRVSDMQGFYPMGTELLFPVFVDLSTNGNDGVGTNMIESQVNIDAAPG